MDDMETYIALTWLLWWLGLSILAAYWANKRGQGATFTLLLGLLLSPLFSFLVVAVVGDKRKEQLRQCPFCLRRTPCWRQCVNCGKESSGSNY